jgi:hypothetical protein
MEVMEGKEGVTRIESRTVRNDRQYLLYPPGISGHPRDGGTSNASELVS